jgi:hypothetical protein
VQVERQPLDGRSEALLHPLGQHLADPAVGSDEVRPDDDLGLGHCQTLAGLAARRIENEADVEDVIRLLRLNYDRVVARHGLPASVGG